MKAIVYARYGAPEELRLVEVPMPEPKADEVLVAVHAVSLNSWDIDLLRGKPFIVRMGGLLTPQHRILGADVAGVVTATGANATRFRVGDAVFGDLSEHGWGGLAEYVAAPERALAAKPEAMSFEAAAATPQAALLALQALRQSGVTAGQSLLINGAGGGVGTFALQMARRAGVRVTAVDHASKLDMLQGLGAEHVIDYAAEDFANSGRRYDGIIDVVASRSASAYRAALTPEGRLVVVGGRTGVLLDIALRGWIGRRRPGPRLTILIYHANVADLDEVAALIASRQIAPVIDRVYPLAETSEAFRVFGEGRVRGKLVIGVR